MIDGVVDLRLLSSYRGLVMISMTEERQREGDLSINHWEFFLSFLNVFKTDLILQETLLKPSTDHPSLKIDSI